MADVWTTRLAGSGSGRAFRMVTNQPSWLGRMLVVLLMLVVLALLAVIVVPVLVIGAVGVLAGVTIGKTRAWLRGLRSPNGLLDERRNVRVIVRE